MSIPLAVDPGTVKPGFHLTVNFLAGSSSPGAQSLKACIISPQATVGGDITNDTEIRSVFSAEDVKTASGRSLGYFAYKLLQLNDKKCQVDLVCPAAGTGQATGTITFGGTPTDTNVWYVYISGVRTTVQWAYGDANTVARDDAVAEINEKVDQIYATASAGTGGVVNIDANGLGYAGDDVTLRVVKVSGTGATLVASGANLTGGTAEPDFTTALSTIEGQEYDLILPCVSNADAQAASGSNPALLETHIDSLDSGSSAKLQQVVLGSTGTLASAATGAVGRNSEVMEHICAVSSESLPCELAGAELGDRMRRRRLRSNANRCGSKLLGVKPAADIVAAQPTDAQADAYLKLGVTTCTYTAGGDVRVDRPITTRSQDASGNPDRRAFDTADIDGIYDYAKDLRTAIPQEFMDPDGGQVNIIPDVGPEEEDPPENVVEERDVRAFIVERTQFPIRKGVIDGVAFSAAVLDGSLIVKVNDDDPHQVDIFIPAQCIPILAKIGVYLAKVD